MMHIGSIEEDSQPAPLPQTQHYLGLGAFLFAGLGAAALVGGWWAVYRGPVLLTRNDNPRRSISDRYVQRGAILDRRNTALAATTGAPGGYTRQNLYPPLSPIIGYSNPIYGQSGLEAGLDPYLRGLRGNPESLIWWNQLLYGQPPTGLDVRLSMDLTLQRLADEGLGNRTGALILMNPQSGEILVMASHPTFDANALGQNWAQLVGDPRAPLVNRAVQGRYPVGALGDLLFPQGADTPGLDPSPEIYLPAASASNPGEELSLNPLQVALSASALTALGVQPTPVLAIAVNTPSQGWINLPAHVEKTTVFTPVIARSRMRTLAIEDQFIWQSTEVTPTGLGRFATWYVAGTLPDWSSMPLAIVVLLEEDNPASAEQIGRMVLEKAMQP
jgi:hypothetical protein